MSHWNYRIIKKDIQNGSQTETTYGIYEVYYKKDKPYLWTEQPQAIYAESIEQLRESIFWQIFAFNKPILEEYIDKKGKLKLREVEK